MNEKILELGLYLIKLMVDYWIFLVLLIFLYSIPAPYLAFKLLRRNRCLGRDIFRELAQADRFMDIWNAKIPLLSSENQYHNAFVPNQNHKAAHNSKIDQQLEKLKLVEIFEKPDSFNNRPKYVQRQHGLYTMRNFIVFILLLFLRITFLGDCMSHIASGNGRISEKGLRRIYQATIMLLLTVVILLIFGTKCL